MLPLPRHEGYVLNHEALAGLKIVKRLALADVVDRDRVIGIIDQMGFTHGAAWLRANRHLYFRALDAVREGVMR
jgi:hypothetical protein